LEMDSTKRTKINYPIIGLITVLVTGTLLFSGCTEQGEEPVIELLGEAQIVVYEKGEEIAIDSKSPYFGELQLACEEMLTSAECFCNIVFNGKSYSVTDEEGNFQPIDIPVNPEEVKNTEWIIEVTYTKTIYFELPLEMIPSVGFPSRFPVSQLLIPLTGKLGQIEGRDMNSGMSTYVYIFVSPKIVFDDYQWEIGTKKDAQEIKDILTRFDINVP